jgi:hypothetical protein
VALKLAGIPEAPVDTTAPAPRAGSKGNGKAAGDGEPMAEPSA